ncbi:SDR family NAD(P)-dependent oxidoreductase [Novosphingobium album (ex Liu et al. 2023)]|uniref:SDR family NAD(P)-dependent oxidoreductase n=1 Tax=Novosphingobium album (ex Liu et al. 2023) TaxID=3031130 RepID=A0ABT5WUH8_9SPHN|nr:SDR family NAD(P)-dependent oxidoreductase [Novosphingobium album (ex Liu et al. 2023)]MDE8653555.1 SDR family NAD(P)-dependent oxidoreductase [Novosphingobium album (ex Liu et al. 2023)]
MDFAAKYGPWAVIAGGSNGTGRSFARQIAARGVACILIAKDGPLEETAEEIRRESDIEVITAEIDLSHEDAAARIFAVVGAREVGLFVNNAGADWFGERFLEVPVEEWLALSRVNVDTMLRCAHRFGADMRRRRRGGIVIVNSGACYGGSKYLAIYCGAKAFQLNFAEALWSEMRPYGVDVVTIVLGRTDTPGYHHRRALRGVTVDGTGLASPDDVAAQALARLPHGPVTNWGLEDEDRGFHALSASQRRDKVLFLETVVMEDSGYRPETDLG